VFVELVISANRFFKSE